MVTPVVKREAVAHLKALLGLSEQRACRIVGADRKMVRYQAQRAPDTVLRGRLRELANERRRFGYRRLFVLLRREGEPSGINRIYRLYREEGLSVRKRKAGARLSEREPRSWSRREPMRAGRWISSMTSSQAASAFGCSTSSTMLPGSASRRSVRHRPRTGGGAMAHPRSRGAEWRVN
ncbi:hypothetical protein GCM10011392_28320 [Wenxinia marina]|nr:hypothetical protein GCM10011392_28320 [Wenxinia marina]